MNRLLLFSIILISTSLSGQNITLTDYKSNFDKDLKDWTSTFTNFNLVDLKKYESRPFDNNYKQDFADLKKFYSVYKPILTFSPDSSSFIDIYSYQLNLEKKGDNYKALVDADQAILLCNKKTKYWDRVYFGTPSFQIEEVVWLTNSKFLLLAVGLNEKDKKIPSILFGDMNKKTITIFNSANKNCYQKKSYRSPKLSRLNIEGL